MTLIHIGGYGNPDGTLSDRVKCSKCGAEDWRKPVGNVSKTPPEWIGGGLCLFCEDRESPSFQPEKIKTAW